MKRFKFRLETVLGYRQTLKKEQERELASRQGELTVAEQHLDEIIAAQDEAGVEEEEQVLTMAEMALQGQYQARMREALEEQRLLILQAADAVEQARDAYIEKSVEAEILENLKERRKEEFETDEVRRERKAQREMTGQRHRFNQKGESEDE